jgi:hypothetical protein
LTNGSFSECITPFYFVAAHPSALTIKMLQKGVMHSENDPFVNHISDLKAKAKRAMKFKGSLDNFLRNGLAKRIFSENEVIFLSTIDGIRFGLIPFKLVPLLERFPKIFIVKKDQNLIEIVGDNFDSRSAAAFAFSAKLKENFEEIAKSCNLQNLKIGWRDEEFGVYPIGADPRTPEKALFKIERALCKVLGIESYGVNCNVFKEEEGTKKLWVGHRSMNKTTFPGKLDTAIGGGMIYGLTVQENLEKVRQITCTLFSISRTQSLGYFLKVK